MNIYLIAGALLALGVAAFWYFGRQPARHKNLTPTRLQALLDVLLRQGFDGGVLFIQDQGKSRFLQVMKYAGSGSAGLQLDFPDAPWSEQYVEPLRRCLQEMNIPFEESSTGRVGVSKFITVDFGRDTQRAQSVVRTVAERVLALDLVGSGVAYFRNVSSDPKARIGL